MPQILFKKIVPNDFKSRILHPIHEGFHVKGAMLDPVMVNEVGSE